MNLSIGRLVRFTLVLLGGIALAASAAVLSVTIFLQGQGLRTRVEETLTRALGRGVHIQKLELSLWSGRIVARQLRIDEDAAFGTTPFVTAERVDLGVEVLPLLLRRQVRINSLVLDEPSVRLLRDATGTWNFASLRRRPAAAPARDEADSRRTDLAIDRFRITDGLVLVSGPELAAAGEQTKERLYRRVTLDVNSIASTRAFPFSISADLPANGHLDVTGKVGPWNSADAVATPVAAAVNVSRLNLEAAGLAIPASGIAGEIESASFDLAWRAGALRVHALRLRSTGLSYRPVAFERPPTVKPADATRALVWRHLLDRLVVDDANVQVRGLTLALANTKPATYRNVVFDCEHWARLEPGTFRVGALLPGEGALFASGTLTPERASNATGGDGNTLDAQVSVRHLDLASSGLLPSGSKIRGLANVQARVRLTPAALHVTGTGRVEHLALAASGVAVPQPVEATFAITRARPRTPGEASIGTLEHATLSFGSATVTAAGTYRISGVQSTTGAASLDLRVNATSIAIDQIEAFLPALGLVLPENSRLNGGTLTTTLAISGSAPHLVIQGPVTVTGTKLAGFDLGSRLTSLARFTGGRIGSATGAGTTLRSLSFDLEAANGQVQTTHIVAVIGGIGTATGEGRVGPGATLNYALSLKLTELIQGLDGGAGLARQLAQQLPGAWANRALGAIDYLASGPMKNGIPVLVGGTARHPTFSPNLGALLPAAKPHR